MDDNFSPRVKDVITYSKEEALRLGHDFIGTEHLMLGILRDGNGKAINILNNLDVDLEHLRRKVEILSPPNPNPNNSTKNNLFRSQSFSKHFYKYSPFIALHSSQR
jgi:ATP-dependent Clp protease ATP-binding subunit ClpC